MTDTRTSDDTPLESRIRAAGATFTQPGVPDGAWQENQRRLLSAPASRRGSARRLLLSVAASVIAVLLLALAITSGGGWLRSDAGPPASSGPDPFDPKYRVGRTVTLERLTLGGKPATHRAFFTRDGVKGLSLCDQYVQDGGTAGGCTSRDPSADEDSVAFDFLTGSSGGSGSSDTLTGLMAGVDDRVDHVDVWTTDGSLVTPKLVRMSDDVRAFSVTVTGSDSRPQRIVAYASDNRVLQAIELASKFGDAWIPDARGCPDPHLTGGEWPTPGSGGLGDISVLWGTSAAIVSGTSGLPPTCVPLDNSPIAGTVFIRKDTLVVLVAPEVVVVRLTNTSGTVSDRKVATSAGSPYGVAEFAELSPADTRAAGILAVDVTGQALDKEPSTPVSP